MRVTWKTLIERATGELADAGVPSPRVDAELLAAHVAGVARGMVPFTPPPDDEQAAAYASLTARRAERVPLQYLIGAHFAGADLAVGDGVFIPRPETELLVDHALKELAGVPEPLVVDLCSGSGAIAVAVSLARPDASVHAVERDPRALEWLRRNVSGAPHRRIEVVGGDATDPATLSELDGTAAAVLSNPPYVPLGTPVEPEVERDPAVAVFGGADGLDVIRTLHVRAWALLRPGGLFAVEHDDTHGEAVPELLRAHGGWTDVAAHRDLAGRARFATARKEHVGELASPPDNTGSSRRTTSREGDAVHGGAPRSEAFP